MAGPVFKTCALRSGSSGNAIFVGNDSTRVLIDAGVCCRTIEESLQTIGESAADLDGLLVTHEHSDHIAGIGVLMRRYKLPVYVNEATWQAMRRSIGAVDDNLVHLLETGATAAIGDLTLTSFATPHDAAGSVGYRIEAPQGSAAVFTDVGSLRDDLLRTVAGCQIVFIEANYDYTMLMAGTYPEMLKQRIAGEYGHLSNEDCASAVGYLLERGTSRFVLSHISKDNNYPELAMMTVNNRLKAMGAEMGRDLSVGIARRFAVSEPVCL